MRACIDVGGGVPPPHTLAIEDEGFLFSKSA